MDTYVILRPQRLGRRAALEQAAAKSTQVGDEEMSDDIRWIRSYVIEEPDGGLGTVCIYQGSSEEKVREHAERAGLPPTSSVPHVCRLAGRYRTRSVSVFDTAVASPRARTCARSTARPRASRTANVVDDPPAARGERAPAPARPALQADARAARRAGHPEPHALAGAGAPRAGEPRPPAAAHPHRLDAEARMRRSEPGRPVADATHSPPLPRANAIERPSGDHVGALSLGPELTTRTSCAVAAE